MIAVRKMLFVAVLVFGFLSTPYASAENVIVTDVVVEDSAEVDLGDPGYGGIDVRDE